MIGLDVLPQGEVLPVCLVRVLSGFIERTRHYMKQRGVESRFRFVWMQRGHVAVRWGTRLSGPQVLGEFFLSFVARHLQKKYFVVS